MHIYTRHTEIGTDSKILQQQQKNEWLESKAQSRFPWNSIINLKTRYGFKVSNKSENPFCNRFLAHEILLTFQNLVIKHRNTMRKFFDEKTD